MQTSTFCQNSLQRLLSNQKVRHVHTNIIINYCVLWAVITACWHLFSLKFSLFFIFTGEEKALGTDNSTSSAVVMKACAPQRCFLFSLLYSHFTHDCLAQYDRDHIIKFVSRKVIEGIQNNDEPCLKEVSEWVTEWWSENKVDSNVTKITEVISGLKANSRKNVRLFQRCWCEESNFFFHITGCSNILCPHMFLMHWHSQTGSGTTGTYIKRLLRH